MSPFRPPLPIPVRRRSCGVLALAVAVALLTAAPAGAVLYKWVDANGRVSYSDQPPPVNVKSEIVNAPAPPSNPDAVRDLANQAQDVKKRQAKAVEDQKKADKARQDEVLLRESCVEARTQVKVYDQDVLLQTFNEKGEPVYLDDTMKKKERARLEAIIRERCQG